ncbi:Rieske (2Fe-2S) protein [Marinicella litoralis]|uniref:Nitrite reductase/ring-hydroxylating ferredoxin subunit n=1 Tax=Marinicella litoralis TaxID=644220 RepID=A0A4R6XYH8_9GAMM|nr:Rieske (2Fe-2S) protein [Marinicella litoralis]TDR23699.1 nitrite reductase/ring-hydroxylating ferredoxin subunit [Marinicella litoralis]
MKHKLAKLIDVPIDKWSEHTLQTENGLTSVMIKRGHAEWVAFVNECPHQGRRMDYAENAFLETPDHQLVCPAHGATFDASTGFCTNGPCVGQSLTQLQVSFDQQDVFVEII